MANERKETIPLDSGKGMRGLLALPETAPPEAGWPGVLVIHDIVGFGSDVQRITRRFAAAGYAALAPAVYDGAGAPFLCVVRTFRDLQKRAGPAFDRLEAARRFLAGQPEVNDFRIGVSGFCMGGGFAIFLASRGGLQVCAPYYGDTPVEAEELRAQIRATFSPDRELPARKERTETVIDALRRQLAIVDSRLDALGEMKSGLAERLATVEKRRGEIMKAMETGEPLTT